MGFKEFVDAENVINEAISKEKKEPTESSVEPTTEAVSEVKKKHAKNFNEITIKDIRTIAKRLEREQLPNQIRYDDFRESNGGPYGDDNVSDDVAHVEFENDRIEKDNNLFKSFVETTPDMGKRLELGKVFEETLLHNMHNKQLLGEHVRIITPTRYDDLENGVDGLLEFKREVNAYSHLAVAFDVTSGRSKADNKIKKILNEINAGTMASMRYFHSKTLGIRGQKDNIRRVVISADVDTAAHNASAWMTEAVGGGEVQDKEFFEKMRVQLFVEMIYQMRFFAEYAESVGQDEIAKGYRSDLSFINAIANNINKNNPIDNEIIEAAKNDRSFKRMREFCEKQIEHQQN